MFVSHEDTLPRFLSSCNNRVQTGAIQPLVGTVDIGTTQDRWEWQELYELVLSQFGWDIKEFPNLHEFIILTTAADVYRGLATDLEGYLQERLACEGGPRLLVQRKKYELDCPLMTRIPKVTSLMYSGLSGR